jgi:hypothetical protein
MSSDPERRRWWRLSFIWLLIGIFVAGNVLDATRIIDWGPEQHDSSDWKWVDASAAMFWLVLGMFALCARDLISILVHHSRPPTQHEIPSSAAHPIRSAANVARSWSSRHYGWIGAAAVGVGALFGHFVWRVGP